MMNKKKLCIIIVIAIIVTGLAVTFAVLSKSGKHKENVNAESTVNNRETDWFCDRGQLRKMRENRYRHL